MNCVYLIARCSDKGRTGYNPIMMYALVTYANMRGIRAVGRTDYNTLLPVLQKHQKTFGGLPEEVTADSGYSSERNLLYLKENQIASYIKLQDHEKRKTRAYAEDISKYYNMTVQIYEDEHYYICHDGRELRHIRTETKEQDGYTQTFEESGTARSVPSRPRDILEISRKTRISGVLTTVHQKKCTKSSCCMRLAGIFRKWVKNWY